MQQIKVRNARTALPPKVEGLERGHLALTFGFSSIDPSIQSTSVQIRALFWGEDPADSEVVTLSSDQPASLRYRLHCGPKFFHRYLEDMEELVLEVADPDGSSLGLCRVGLAHILTGRPHVIRTRVPITTAGGRHVGSLDFVAEAVFNEIVDSFEMNEFLAENARASQIAALSGISGNGGVPPSSSFLAALASAEQADELPYTSMTVSAAAEPFAVEKKTGGGGGGGGGAAAPPTPPPAHPRQSRDSLPLLEQPPMSSSPAAHLPAAAAAAPGPFTLPPNTARRSIDLPSHLPPIDEGMLSDTLPSQAAAILTLAAQVRADPTRVRATFQEIAASRSRASKIPNEIPAQDISRAARLLASTESKASAAVSKADSEFLDLMLGLGPVDPTDKRVFTVTPEDFTAALYDAANAVRLVYSEDAEARRRAAEIMQGFCLEAGRRQLEVQNKFREIGWNQGGEVTPRQLAHVLAAALPAAGPSETRLALCALTRATTAAGRPKISLEDFRAMLRDWTESQAAPPAGSSAPVVVVPMKRPAKAKGGGGAKSGVGASAKTDIRGGEGAREEEEILREAPRTVSAAEALDARPLPRPSQILAGRREGEGEGGREAPPSALTPIPAPLAPAAPAPPPPVIEPPPPPPPQQQQQQPSLPAPTPALAPPRQAPLDALIQRAMGLRTAMDVALQSSTATRFGRASPAAAPAPAPAAGRGLIASLVTPLTEPHQLPAAVARAFPAATYNDRSGLGPDLTESTDCSGTDVSSVVEDALMSELFFARREPIPAELSWMPPAPDPYTRQGQTTASAAVAPRPAPAPASAKENAQPNVSSSQVQRPAIQPKEKESGPKEKGAGFELSVTIQAGDLKARPGTELEAAVKGPGGVVLLERFKLQLNTPQQTLRVPCPPQLLDKQLQLQPAFLVLEVSELSTAAAAGVGAAAERTFVGLAKFALTAPPSAEKADVAAAVVAEGRADVYHPVRATGIGTVGIHVALAPLNCTAAPTLGKDAPSDAITAVAAAAGSKAAATRRRDSGAAPTDRMDTSAAAAAAPHADMPPPDVVAVRHTFDVQLAGIVRLPVLGAYAGGRAGRLGSRTKLPTGRYVKYFFPGEPEPLETRVFAVEAALPVAATARHAITLPPGEDLLGFIAGPGGRQALRFEVWTKWDRGVDSCLCTAEVDLREASAAQGSQTFHLALQPEPKSVEALLLRNATLKLQIGYQRVDLCPDDPLNESDLRALEAHAQAAQDPGATAIRTHEYDHDDDHDGRYGAAADAWDDEDADVAPSSTAHAPLARMPPLPVLPAVLRCEIVRAMGLGAAVQEATLYFGAEATPMLGRSSVLGPHSYVRLSLFPGDEDLEAVFPTLRTPFQAQTFTPEYHYTREYTCKLQEVLLRALAVGEAAVELWHHSPRSLQAHGPMPAAAEKAPMNSKVRDVFLGQGAVQLAPILTQPRGVDTWVPLRSRRGEHVGCIQVRIRLLVPGLDDAPSAVPPTPLPAEELYLQGTAPAAPRGPTQPPDATASGLAVLDLYPELKRALPATLDLPTAAQICGALIGRAARAHLFIEEVILPAPAAAATHAPADGSAPAVLAAPDRPKAASYYAQWIWPDGGLPADRTPAKGPTSPSAPWLPYRVPLKHSASCKLQLYAHVLQSMVEAPLEVQVWRQDPPKSATGLGHAPPAVLLGSAHVDLLPLLSGKKVTSAAGVAVRTGRESKWLSGAYFLVHPGAKNLAGAKVRVRLMLEVFPGGVPALPVAKHTPEPAFTAPEEEEEEEEGGAPARVSLVIPPPSPARGAPGLRSNVSGGFVQPTSAPREGAAQGAEEEGDEGARGQGAAKPPPPPAPPSALSSVPAPATAFESESDGALVVGDSVELRASAAALQIEASRIEAALDLSTLTEEFEEDSRATADLLPDLSEPAAPPHSDSRGELHCIVIDHALHLDTTTGGDCSIEASFTDGSPAFATAAAPLTPMPAAAPDGYAATWLHAAQLRLQLPTDALLILRVSVRSPGPAGSALTLGCAVVDLAPLALGLPELDGYYNVIDFTQRVRGQIKVGVKPFARGRANALRPPFEDSGAPRSLEAPAPAPEPHEVAALHPDLPSPDVSMALDVTSASIYSEAGRTARERLQEQLEELEGMLDKFRQTASPQRAAAAAANGRQRFTAATSMTGFGLQPNLDEPVWTRHESGNSSTRSDRDSGSAVPSHGPDPGPSTAQPHPDLPPHPTAFSRESGTQNPSTAATAALQLQQPGPRMHVRTLSDDEHFTPAIGVGDFTSDEEEEDYATAAAVESVVMGRFLSPPAAAMGPRVDVRAAVEDDFGPLTYKSMDLDTSRYHTEMEQALTEALDAQLGRLPLNNAGQHYVSAPGGDITLQPDAATTQSMLARLLADSAAGAGKEGAGSGLEGGMDRDAFLYGFSKSAQEPAIDPATLRSAHILQISGSPDFTPSASASETPSRARTLDPTRTRATTQMSDQDDAASKPAVLSHIASASSMFSWSLPPAQPHVTRGGPTSGLPSGSSSALPNQDAPFASDVTPGAQRDESGAVDLPAWARELLHKKKEESEASRNAARAAQLQAEADLETIRSRSSRPPQYQGEGADMEPPPPPEYPKPGPASFRFMNALPPGPANN